MEILKKVSEVVSKTSALQVEKLARIIFIKRNKKFGYTQDEAGIMYKVLEHEARVDEVDVESYEATMEIVELLKEDYPDWEQEVQALGGFVQFLSKHGVEVEKVMEAQQKEITLKAVGKEMTVDEMGDIIISEF